MTESTASLAFLLGVPRSGTSLLAHLLQRHPDIVAPPESWIMLALHAFGRTSTHHPADAQVLAQAMDELLGRVDAHAAFRALADRVYDDYRTSAAKRLLVDKTPRYWMILDFLDALYPDAPRIVLIRNPYAIAASLKTTWGVKLHPIDWEDDSQLRYLADLVVGLPKLHEFARRPGVAVVRYEHLVENPSAELSLLFRRLGCTEHSVEFGTEQSLDYLAKSAFGDRKILEWPNVGTESVDLWRTQLDDVDLQAVTDLVGAFTIESLGYGPALAEAGERGVVAALQGEGTATRHRLANWYATQRRLATVSSTLRQRLPEDEAFLADLRLIVRVRDAEIERLSGVLAESEADRSARLALIHERDAEIEQLSAALDSLRSTAARFEMLQASWPWRLARRLRSSPIIGPVVNAAARSTGLSATSTAATAASVPAPAAPAEPPETIVFRAASTARALQRIAARSLPIATVIDVGASNGMWSVVTREIYPDADYLLVEAQRVHEPALIEYCRTTPRSSYVLAAAGDHLGEIYFDDSAPFGGVASHERQAHTRTVVPLTTIDHEVTTRGLQSPFLVKLDTHGFEVPILEGAAATLRNTNLVIIEVYNFRITDTSLLFDEMCVYMRERGFGVIDVSEPLWREHDNAFWQMDLFFVPLDRQEFAVRTYR